MKNICWTTLIILCFQQVYAQKKIYIGLTGSPCVAWLQPRASDLNSDKTRIGFAYGVMTDFSFTENYAFGTGLRVSHHGGEINYITVAGIAGGRLTETYKLQYLQVPLTLKMRTKEIGYFTYYGQFGLGAAYLIGAGADTRFTSNGVTVEKEDVNVYDDLQPFRASLIIGLGTEYNVSGSTRLIFGISFDNGFINPLEGRIYERNENGNYIKGDKVKAVTNLVSLDLGIIF